VLVEAQVRLGACHADIDQRLGELVVRIGLAKSRLVPHPGVQLDHIHMGWCRRVPGIIPPRA